MFTETFVPAPLFSKAMEKESARSLGMLFLLENCLHANAKNGIDKLCFYCKIVLQTSTVDGKKVSSILQKMQCEMILQKGVFKELNQALFKALFPFFYESRWDENILSWFLENKKALISTFGKELVQKLFFFLSPQGIDGFMKVIEGKMSQRGFPCNFG